MNEATLAATIILSAGAVLVSVVSVVLHGRGTNRHDDQNSRPCGSTGGQKTPRIKKLP